MKYILSLIIIFIANIQLVLADEVTQNVANELKQHSSREPGFGSVVFSLLFVICLIYVTGLIYSKLNAVGAKTVKKQLKKHDLSQAMVLSTTQLGQGKNLHVIEINNQKMLIGATQHSINLIKELKFEEIEQEEDKRELVNSK